MFHCAGTSIYSQGVWVQDHEIDAIIDYARSQGSPEYDESITSGAVALAGGGSGDDRASRWINDKEFHAAVQILYRANKTPPAAKHGIGYNKATTGMVEDLGFSRFRRSNHENSCVAGMTGLTN